MTSPEAVHVGRDDLPYVDIGDGSKLRVLQVKPKEGLWVVENIFQAAYEVPTHKHTGPVWGYTRSGAGKYKEYDYVNRAGSFLYEPAGSIHTLQVVEDDTHVWFQMYGCNLNLDADGKAQDLPMNTPVEVEVTVPAAGGDVRFACGMDMYTGVIAVN